MQLLNRLRTISRRSRATDPASAAPNLRQQFQALMDTRDDVDLPPPSGVRVGIASFGAGPGHIVVDCLLAHALRQRGATSQLLVCDLPSLPGCDERRLEDEPNDRCQGCITTKTPFLDVAGLDWVTLSANLPDPDATLALARELVAACPDDGLTEFELEGWPLGQWLGASVASFLRSDSHGMRAEVVAARRRYLVSGIVAFLAARAWLDAWQPDVLIVISGRHIFWRAAREIAESRGIKVVCREMWNEAFDCHIYAVNSSCEDPVLTEAWAEARHRPLTPEQDALVDEFLSGLPAYARQVTVDPTLVTRESEIRTRLGLDPQRPLIALFTNVGWDLWVAERDVAFDGQMHWIADTIDFVRAHPEIDVVVRAHPAEIVPKFQTRGRIVDQIIEEHSPLPDNLRLVGPESDISSDTLRAMASLNLVYCASVGMEATIAEQPVILCGNPYYARKGFTVDVESPEHYRRILEDHVAGSPPVPPPDSAVLARRLYYLFKFRYAMHMGLTTDQIVGLGLTVSHLDELAPGRSVALDTACDGILHGDEILLPA